jgi:hypothetical protein
VTMPTVYPHGGPLYWMHEQSGLLRAAILAYLDACETAAQLALVIEYCQYWVDAPCWRGLPSAVQDRGAQIRTHIDLQAWLAELLEYDIDPF